MLKGKNRIDCPISCAPHWMLELFFSCRHLAIFVHIHVSSHFSFAFLTQSKLFPLFFVKRWNRFKTDTTCNYDTNFQRHSAVSVSKSMTRLFLPLTSRVNHFKTLSSDCFLFLHLFFGFFYPFTYVKTKKIFDETGTKDAIRNRENGRGHIFDAPSINETRVVTRN